MKNRLKKLRLESETPNSLAIWQRLANLPEIPAEYLVGWTNDRATVIINDLNLAEEDAYERIIDMLSREYPRACPEFNWPKISQLPINSDIIEKQKVENTIYKEEVYGRITVVKEMDMPSGHYYIRHIEILHRGPFSWICSVYPHR